MTTRSWRWALVASLALNLLLLGVMGSWWWRIHEWRSGRSALGEIVATLPEPDRTDLGRLIDQRREEGKANWEQLGRLRDAAKEALAADPYDPNRVAAAFAALRDKSNDLREDSQATLLQVVPKLSAQQRRQLVERRGALGPM